MKTVLLTKASRRTAISASPRRSSAPTRVRALKPKGEYWTDAELLALGEGSDIKQDFDLLPADRMLTGNSVLPGFRVSLARIFEGI